MADIIMARGGQPDFKGWMCDGQWQEYGPPYSGPHMDATPPFNSHADAAHEQGFLNLHFPLVPHLGDTEAHRWMVSALKGLTKVGDRIFTNWVPLRSYLDSVYYEVTRTDPLLDGVYLTPVAARISPDFKTGEWKTEIIDDFAAELAAAGVSKLPLGTPQENDLVYGMARLSLDPARKPCTFGHNIPLYDNLGKAVGPFDEYFGTVLLGFEVEEGTPEKIARIHRGHFSLYFSSKLMAFEGSSQVG